MGERIQSIFTSIFFWGSIVSIFVKMSYIFSKISIVITMFGGYG